MGWVSKKLHLMNQACLMKLGWQLRCGKDSLWCSVLLGKYGRQGVSDQHLAICATDSSIWKAIAGVWPTLCSFMANGESISSWWDKWIDQHCMIVDIFSNIPLNLLWAKVADFVAMDRA